jgi:hypothetical protein
LNAAFAAQAIEGRPLDCRNCGPRSAGVTRPRADQQKDREDDHGNEGEIHKKNGG